MRSFAQFLGQGDELSLLARYLYLTDKAPVYKYIVVTRARLGYFHGDVSARKTRLHVHAYPVVTHASIGQRLRSSDRKSTRLNSSHANISYAVFCLKKKKILA